jgi:hypothetical protein
MRISRMADEEKAKSIENAIKAATNSTAKAQAAVGNAVEKVESLNSLLKAQNANTGNGKKRTNGNAAAAASASLKPATSQIARMNNASNLQRKNTEKLQSIMPTISEMPSAQMKEAMDALPVPAAEVPAAASGNAAGAAAGAAQQPGAGADPAGADPAAAEVAGGGRRRRKHKRTMKRKTNRKASRKNRKTNRRH